MNNKELFIRWYAWSLHFKDCDPAVWMTNYLHERYQHNEEQKMWFAWLYGNTYNLPTAWVLFNEFPDFELATVSRMTEWNSKNYKRLRYQTDTKWNKGHLPIMFESYQKFINYNHQKSFFQSLYADNEFQNFNNIFKIVKETLYKFGRYSTWFYLQHLKHTAGIILEPSSLLLNDFSGSKSHRNGLLHVLDREELIDKRLTEKEYSELEEEAREILIEMKERFPLLNKEIDFFTMETALCAYKKIFRKSRGRYLGYYLDRQGEEIVQARGDRWEGIDWFVLDQSREEVLDSRVISSIIRKEYFGDFINRGVVRKLEMLFADSPIVPVNRSLLDF